MSSRKVAVPYVGKIAPSTVITNNDKLIGNAKNVPDIPVADLNIQNVKDILEFGHAALEESRPAEVLQARSDVAEATDVEIRKIKIDHQPWLEFLQSRATSLKRKAYNKQQCR